MIAEAERYFTIRNEDGIAVISCALCSTWEMVVEKTRAGQKVARERTMAHLRTMHSCRGC